MELFFNPANCFKLTLFLHAWLESLYKLVYIFWYNIALLNQKIAS